MSITLAEVNYIAYSDGRENIIYTEKREKDETNEPVPALDLLEGILKSKGVMQLETSRGCPNSCSFCPRCHKGKWFGYEPVFLENIMPYISKIFEAHPNIARKIFLVDEEWIGYKNHNSLKRVKSIADILFKYNFRFETSARIDQVYRADERKDWHIERIKFWKYLAENGLERVLFGIESGVDSILRRFNKNTTKEQNVYAIRILTSCNIPVRYTYITFDPLMTMNELVKTYRFQGRKDLLLKPLPYLSEYELYELIHDGDIVSSFSSNIPFYRRMPYLLVSLECLLNSPYLRIVQEKGLAGKTILSMGKREVSYLCPEIGLLSYFSQLWIDRNFALDYTLKSLIKISNKKDRQPLHELRAIIKDYAYNLLGKMLFIITKEQRLIIPLSLNEIEHLELQNLAAKWDKQMLTINVNKTILMSLLDYQITALAKALSDSFCSLKNEIPSGHRATMEQSFERWQSKNSWNLINEH